MTMGDQHSGSILKFRPACTILGLNVSAVDMRTALKFITENKAILSGQYVCVSNVHTTVMSYESEEYLSIQNDACMVLPDGGPLSYVGRKKGYHQMERVTGPDLMEEVFKISPDQGYRHYFLGSTQETLEKLKCYLEKTYGGLQIAGMYSPPFNGITDIEDHKIISLINDANADFVWVGLGAPKQEIWMYRHQGRVHGIMIGVGAGFDYCAGNIKRAPGWMQRNNLEWFYRLCQEPGRLFKRYLTTNFKFLYLLMFKNTEGKRGN